MDDNCPTHIKGAFLDVSQAPGPGEQYNMMPRLQVTCSNGNLVINSNSVPHYNFIPMTPNDLVERDEQWRVPLEPSLDHLESLQTLVLMAQLFLVIWALQILV